MSKIVTRFAPSPTGKPHVGNIRTAIFAYLWARHNQGNFLLRIEDTDRERLVSESLKYIEESLGWLGLDYDHKIIYQSERRKIHQKYAEMLLEMGRAYKCFCSKERLQKLREEQIRKKLPPGYDSLCRNFSENEAENKETKKYVIRFKMPQNGSAVWLDGIRGKMQINYVVSNDPIIIKSDNWPTYHLAAVVDDHEQGVTDVIRGEEWISSTPKHLALYEAFDWSPPRFSHLPHINGPDGTKLSKRHGDTSILDYKENGYLPESVFNFLAILGWNDGTEKEIFTKNELIKAFDLFRVGKSPAVFDIKKLDWLNGQYIRSFSTSDLRLRISKLIPNLELLALPNFDRILEVEKTRLVRLTDIMENTNFYIKEPKINKKTLIFKKSTPGATHKGMEAACLALGEIDVAKWQKMNVSDFSDLLSEVVGKHNLTNGDVFWSIRYALSGLEKSPSPAELLWVFEKNLAVDRIKKALKLL